MKKYKLIKTYPGSPKLGTIKPQDTIISGITFFDRDKVPNRNWIENYPEFWEEVVENNNPLNLVLGKTYKIRYKFYTSPIKICKVDRFTQHGHPWTNSLGGIITDSYELIEEVIKKDYEILSYQSKDKIIAPASNFAIEISKPGHWNIHSVKRKSDGKVFTIGDECNPIGEYSNNRGTIDKIEFCEVGYLRLTSKNWYMNIDGIEHSKKPLFTTEFQILSFKSPDFKYILEYLPETDKYANDFKQVSLENCLKYHNIESVKRISDNVIFNVGDYIKEGRIINIIIKNFKIYLDIK